MNRSHSTLQVEWLIACLSPGDIAPHPNFKASQVGGPGLLALITQFQWREFETYREAISDEADSKSLGRRSDQFLNAARRVLESETIVEGRRELKVLAED